jgi:hypothetical protein
MSHSALTYAMLLKRVIRNPKLTRVSGTQVLEYSGRQAAVLRRLGDATRQWLWCSTTLPFQMVLSGGGCI